MILLSIPFNKLPWLLLLANLIIGIENQILADLEKYTVHTWMEKQIGLLLSDHRYCIHRYIKYTLRYRGYSRFPYYISDVTRLYKTVTQIKQIHTWQKNHPQNYFLTFLHVSKSQYFFSNLNYNCFNLLDLKNLQEQVKKAFCYQTFF